MDLNPADRRPVLAERVAVIGDVGGHLDELRRELVRLGSDERTGQLPAGLVVIQVGDLIHRGPNSAGVIDLIDGYLNRQPDQWIQLTGNHEAQYLRKPVFEWPERLESGSIATLRRWWAQGQMRAAASLTSSSEQFLITHAGLTGGYWREILSAVADPDLAAAAINSFIGTYENVLFHAGQMLGGDGPDPLAGPIWAAAATELLPSWLGVELPFSQLHGHSRLGPVARKGRRLRGSGRRGSPAAPSAAWEEIDRRTVLDEPAGHEITTLDGGRIIGIDPGHSHHARDSWRAWELNAPSQIQS